MIDEPIFKTEPLFILGCSHARFSAKLLREWKIDQRDDDSGQLGTMYTFSQAPWRVIWTKTLDAPVVLHEVFHLVTRICEDRGVPIVAHHPNGSSGDETAAFLFEFFARAVLRRLPKC